MQARHLILIAYDIADNRARARVADRLERDMVRVQDSLFEGWMAIAAGERLAREAAATIDVSDSVRMYVVPRGTVGAARAWGFPPAPLIDGLLIV